MVLCTPELLLLVLGIIIATENNPPHSQRINGYAARTASIVSSPTNEPGERHHSSDPQGLHFTSRQSHIPAHCTKPMALATPLRLLLPAAASPTRPPDPAGPSCRALPSRQGHLRSTLAAAPPSPAARTVAAAGAGGGRPTVLVTEKLGSAGLDLLREFANVDCSYELTTEELRAKVSLVDALVVRSATRVTREVFEAARGRLRVVGRAGVGIDNVDLQAATEAGCLVVNAPTANTVAAAEHAVALITAMARNVAQADASLKASTYACPSPRAR
jgi:hypothetical protein